MLGRFIKSRERRHAARDTNRVVRPFEWGAEFVVEHTNGDDPRDSLTRAAREALSRSEEFYALPPVEDYELRGERLTWTSAVRTPSPENNTASARFFPERKPARRSKNSTVVENSDAENSIPENSAVENSAVENSFVGNSSASARRAVVVLPQWNADAESHVALCRLLSRLGIAALRLTMPYHEERRPAGLERADFLVCPNVGRTLQSMRQAVVDARASVAWLADRGYERIGIVGTSIGSCTAFLAFVHEERLDAGVFNHVSGYFADVVWRGISTRHVRAGVEGALTLEELRESWLPISPMPFAERLAGQRRRPMRFIAARHDLTFPADLSRDVIARVRSLGVPLDVAWLPCGHYTSGERPWVYLDGWKIVSFIRRNL